MTKDLYEKLVCAITHNMIVCESCKKCPGKDFAEIRTNLVKELAKEEGKELPFTDDENESKN